MQEILKKYNKQILALVIFLTAYLPAILWMLDRWWARDSYYSHGILIPLVSGFFIWQLKDDIKELIIKESPWGMRLIFVGVIIYFVASIFRVYFISAVSMMIVFYGLILYFYGMEVFKKILFPLLFLFFMVPLPMVAIANISFKMKLFAAEMATAVINNMGIPAIRDGSIVKMPHAHVIVDDVCSGLRSLISLMALGSIFAYWFKGKMYKRVLVFILTIPIAVITNMCRVVILSVISEVWGTEYAGGFVHDATGFLVFVIAFILLYFVVKVLEED